MDLRSYRCGAWSQIPHYHDYSKGLTILQAPMSLLMLYLIASMLFAKRVPRWV